MAYRPMVDVNLILLRADGRVLLAERANTGFADGLLNLPSGKLEAGEDIRAATLREAGEEVGVRVGPQDVQCASVIHHRSADGESRVGFFFLTSRWEGEPVNAEPHKCAGLLWADPERLPENTVPYTAAGLQAWRSGQVFGLDGWGGTYSPT